MHLSVYMIEFVDEKEIAVQPCNCNLQTVYGDIDISQSKFVKLLHKN